MINPDKPKQIPYSSEAEASVLGALMTNNDLLERLGFLHEEHFFATAHQRIFAEIKRLIENNQIANPITLKNKADADPDLKELGGAKYLIQCINCSIHNPLQTAHFLREMHQRRVLIEVCSTVCDNLFDNSCDLAKQTAIVSEVCEKMTAGGKEWETRTGEEVAQAIIDDLKNDVQPFKTGMNYLDEAMDGGLYPGKMYGFAGRKKTGKTIMAGTLSCNLAIAGVKHLFICCEMSPEEIHQRNLARMGAFYPSSFRNSYSRSHDFQNKLNTAMQWSQRNILYRNAPALTFEKLRYLVKRSIQHDGIKGFILDYWQLVGGKESKKSTAEHLDDVAQWCADTCRKHGVWGIVMGQINQDGTTRGSEGLRLACDQMYQINRQDVSRPQMWLEMMETRYTPWKNIGEAGGEKIELNSFGPWFQEV